MYRKEQEEYEVAMKSYNKEASSTSYIPEPTPSVAHASPVPTDAGNHSYSDRPQGVDMTLTSSQQESYIIDEDEGLLETEPQPGAFPTPNQEIDADNDELLDDDDFQMYSTNLSSNKQAHKWQEQKNTKLQSIK
jgi:hypothetical protein